MARVAVRIELSESERLELRRRQRGHCTAHRDRERARIVLLASEGTENRLIARQLDLSVKSVAKWRERFSLERLQGVRGCAGPGPAEYLSPRADRNRFEPGGAAPGPLAALELPHDGARSWDQ
jgi:DNA-binding CsgD family transcriptional regulator